MAVDEAGIDVRAKNQIVRPLFNQDPPNATLNSTLTLVFPPSPQDLQLTLVKLFNIKQISVPKVVSPQCTRIVECLGSRLTMSSPQW